MIDLTTIDERLAKAKEDVAFWERARSIFIDPRISLVELDRERLPVAQPLSPATPHRPYGELKRKVLEVLPPYGSVGTTTNEIVSGMQRGGYVFASRVPAIAVNEALVSLGDEAFMAGRRGISKLWTLGELKTQDQQQTPP